MVGLTVWCVKTLEIGIDQNVGKKVINVGLLKSNWRQPVHFRGIQWEEVSITAWEIQC